MEKIILASGSPRRRELLAQAGIPFEVLVSEAEEIITKTEPGEIVEELSLCKARAVADRYAGETAEQTEDAGKADKLQNQPLILGADTIVVQDGKILGKPHSENEAFQMLQSLSGRTHSVYTGVTFIQGARECSFHEKTEVHVYPMTEAEIRSYIASGDCMDKAGAYGIQGSFAAHIQGICGDYYTVMGLPVGRVYQELKKWERN